MRIAISGATGLIGTPLVEFLGSTGHEVRRLVRQPALEDGGDIPWDPATGHLASSALEGFDAVVCLSGAGIAERRWTPARKEELRGSRVDSVGLLARSLELCRDRPECLICASSTGFYGADRGNEVLTEDSPGRDDFLGTICAEWESAAWPAHAAGIRVVNLRFGIVLSAHGGALARMHKPFRLGLGGTLGNGRQFMSWIGLDDAVSAIDFAIQTDGIEGPVNVVAPKPVTNREFTRALGRALHRPTVARVPSFALRAAIGEMSCLVLGSLRVYPRRLEAAGFQFRHGDIETTLASALSVAQVQRGR